MATVFAQINKEQMAIRANSYHESLEIDENLDAGSSVSDAFQYGLPAAIVSGAIGTFNTGVSFVNAFGANANTIDVETTIEDFGWENTSAYYADHKATIDAVGFGISALIPGLAGFKLAKAAQGALSATNSTSRLVTGMKAVLVPAERGKKYLNTLKADQTTFSRFTLGRKAAAQGFHQNLIEATFAETAILLTNAKNPSISKPEESYGEAILNNMGGLGFGIILGTGIGGLISTTLQYSTLKKVFDSSAKASNAMASGAKLTPQGFPIGSNGGDNVALMWNQLGSMKSNLGEAASTVDAAALKKLNTSIKLQEQNIADTIANMVGELNKKGELVNDAQLTGQIMRALRDATPEQATDIFANLTKITRHSETDLLMNPTVSPLLVVGDDEFAQVVSDILGRPTTAPDALGINIAAAGGRATAIVIRDSVMRGADLDKALFVLRHEMGHDNANRLANAWDSESAKGIVSDGEALSRIARGAHWSGAESLLANATKSLERAKKIGADQNTLNILGDQMARATKDLEYLQDPKEILADSWAMFNRSEADRIKFAKEFPSMHKLLDNNSAIKLMLGKTEAAMDLKTLDMYMIPDRQPTVADMGSVKFQSNTGKVVYANGVVDTNFGRNTNLKAKSYNVLEQQDSETASAHFFAANASTKMIPNTAPIPWTDFASLNVILRQADAGELLQPYKITLPDGTEGTFNFGKNAFATADENLSRFRAQYRALKMEAISQIRNTSLNGKRSMLTESEIARITDTHERFVQHGGHVEDDAIPFWSSEYNPNQATMVKMHYSVKSEFANKNIAEGINELNLRHAANLESAHNSVVSFGSRVGTGISEGMPMPSTVSGFNQAQEVTEATALRGFTHSTGGEYGRVESFIQGVANFNENFKKKFYSFIDDEVASSALILKNDGVALQEAATLDSVLRRDFFKFSPITKDGNTEQELVEFLSGFADNADALKRVDEIIGVVIDPIKSRLQKGTVLWTRKLENALANAMKTKKFGPSTLDKIKLSVDDGLVNITNSKLEMFWRNKVSANSTIVEGKQTIAGIRGLSSNLDPDVLYPGAFDIGKFKHRKFIHPRKNGMFTDDKAGIIAATTPEGLIAKERQVRDAFGDDIIILTPDDIRRNKKLSGQYLQGLDLTESQIDSVMKRKGILWDLVPEPSPDIVDHYIRDMKGQAKGIVDNMTDAAYADEFATLRFQSDRIQLANTSGKEASKIVDPNQDAINIMLNDSAGNSLWRTAQQDVDRTISKGLNAVKSMFTQSKTQGDFQQMNKFMEDSGLPLVYNKSAGKFLNENEGINETLLASVVPMANGAAGTMMLRLDLIQPLVTALSTPITSIPEIKHLLDSVPLLKAQQVRSSLKVNIPRDAPLADGQLQHSMPSNTKLMYQAAKDYWTMPELVKKYKDLGFTPSIVQEMRDQAGRIALDPKVLKEAGGLSKYKSHIDSLINTLAKPADFMEGFVKFQAARMADLTLTAAGITNESIKNLAILTYVKRVHGNYTYAQRPTMFQGFAGQAIGLFQTYQFNMIQQMFRHIGDENFRAAGSMLGIQAGMFGTQSIPGFQAMNQHIGERSVAGRDFYTGAEDVLGNEVSEWLLYGVSSNFTKPIFSATNYIGLTDVESAGLSLFSRGDLTPRTPILLPTSMAEIPIINLSTKFINNILDTANAIAGDVPVSQIFADALAKNGVNRPLSGIGQLLGGAKTTTKGSLIASQQDVDWWSRMAKVAGTSNLDEGIAVQSYYRAKGYDTYRREQMNAIGIRTKSMIRSGEYDAEAHAETFERYAELGGNAENYQSWMHGQYMGATTSIIENMRTTHNSPSGRYLQNLMGTQSETGIDAFFTVTPKNPLDR